jgi:patatin-like phospholipase/acyl hydrolase
MLLKCFRFLFFSFITQQAFAVEALNLLAYPALSGLAPRLSSMGHQLGLRSLSVFPDAKRKTIRILSIDGGGIRGIIPLTVLRHIEKQTGKPISDSFDVIAGTSTGGIIALGLCVPNAQNRPKYPIEGAANGPVKGLMDIYKEKNTYIFSNPWWVHIPLVGEYAKKAHDLVYAKYSKEGLENTLRMYFETEKEAEEGEKRFRLSDSLKPVLVPAFNMRESKLHLFDSEEAKRIPTKDFYMTDVAYSTAAAPTYFPPAKIRDCLGSEDYKLIDGGVVANNPSLLALLKANELFGSNNNFYIVSLGTGQKTFKTTRFRQLENSGIFHWAFHLPRLMINASNSHTKHCLDELKYVSNIKPPPMRFERELRQDLMALDSTHREIIGRLEDEAEDEIKRRASEFETLFNILKQD